MGIKRILIANRGEIALRIHRAAHEIGIETVAVHSTADADAMHVRLADHAVCIGPPAASESYLNIANIISAAEIAQCDAIHPGYGFLSENAKFADIVEAHDIIWIGPKPEHIRTMGDKIEAKRTAGALGLPLVPGSDGAVSDITEAKAIAEAAGYPVIIKAASGGGGRGMKVCNGPDQLETLIQQAGSEAKAAFGDATVYIEKYLGNPRHIEFQVFGDGNGNAIHLGERDCSLQRRHQKVIEEAPAPGMDAATREAICAAAVRAAKAVDYEGAGTIEFIADASEGLRADRIFFMEMNTRLQVEHPVTEEITGVDLVEWQLRVASGEPLPLAQEELSINGHAIEARLYAEDPAKGFLPSTGRLKTFDLRPGRWGRLECAVETGDEVTPYYDPMIAKVIARAENRTDALEQLSWLLSGAKIWPVKTNTQFLIRSIEDADFEAGNLDTGLIERKLEQLIAPILADEEEKRAGALNLLMGEAMDRMLCPAYKPDGSREFRPHVSTQLSPMLGFRLNSEPNRRIPLIVDGQPTEAVLSEPVLHANSVDMSRYGDEWLVLSEGVAHHFQLAPTNERGTGQASAADGAIIAPMPGKVIAVDVSEGQTVTAGQRLMVLEAMKMEHALTAPFDGVVEGLSVSAGGQVQVEAVLCRVVPQ